MYYQGSKKDYEEFFAGVIWRDLKELMQEEEAKYTELVLDFSMKEGKVFQLIGENNAWARGALAKVKDFIEFEESIPENLAEELEQPEIDDDSDNT